MLALSILKKFAAVICSIVALSALASAQGGAANGLVSSARTATITTAQLNSRMNTVFGASAVDPARSAVEFYKISYRSRTESGGMVVLTGLVLLPREGAPKGLVVFNHGTIYDRRTSPSRYTGKADGTEPETAMLAFTTGGYAVVLPDYIGLGDHQAAHPYPLNVANSHAGVDIIKPARALARRQNIELDSKLFVTGYSEGGGVAMAQVRELERSSDLAHNVFAAAPTSGPYDLSGATREFLLVRSEQQGFVIKLYLLSYSAYYFHKAKGTKLTDYFKPSMAFTVSQAFKGTIKDEEVIKRLAVAATLMRSKNSLSNVLTPRFLKAMQTTDTRDPLVRELRDNDVFDWTPRTKMLLVNLEGDGVVSPENTENAFRAMRRRGVGRDSLRRYIIKDSKLNHINAVPTAMLKVRQFFDSGFAGMRDLDSN